MGFRVNRLNLRHEITCASCWHRFPPEEVLWISTHPELIGDTRLGDDAAHRFLPSRFDAGGNALDRNGSACSELACPRCHLVIPRPLIEMPAMFLSIAGTPSCGKSYFLASMAWQMRRSLPAEFKVAFSDADPSCNRILNDYEEQQFFNSDRDTLIRLRKTEEQGDHYTPVRIGDQVVSYPRPFLFALRPMPGHPNESAVATISRLLCLYDNAGESFLPGRDDIANPVTRHLAEATALFFCFDPTQDPRMRIALEEQSNVDFNVAENVTARQEIVFHEMTQRFRRLTGTSQTDVTDRPLVVIVTKYDSWKALAPSLELPGPFRTRKDGTLSAIDLSIVQNVSNQVRGLLFQFSPELVSAAESFSRNVLFVPVSATGSPPVLDPSTGIVGVRPRDIAPVWCDVPLAAVIAKHGAGLIPYVQ